MNAKELVTRIRTELHPGDHDNLVVKLIETGQAPRAVIQTFAAEENHIVSSDWRTFLALASKAEEPNARAFFTLLAGGEELVLPMLPALAEASGMSAKDFQNYEPFPGCQAYPAYQAWMALNGDPADVILAILANFTAWGGYCARMAKGLREHYGFGDEACAFVDFFATPAPQLEERAIAAIQASLDAGWQPKHAWRYGRLLQAYELQFWSTLA
ncbi:transcriptional regulator [Lentzea californiensis]|uniref:transcriptional regulator n=1 Tax=Lentzea californiensis TaxID=438851 RepID=UPI00216547D5|nr:transcriptional regulator [Lentzea californiensis]MCR3750918.1 TENA/THI-4/PQQC family protein [Lentzea californiensis]